MQWGPISWASRPRKNGVVRKYGFGAIWLMAAVLLAALDRQQWSWAWLGLGLLVGAAGVAGSFAIGRRAGIDADGWEAYPSFVLMSLGVAVLSAGLASGWPDLLFAAYVVVANFAVPLVLLSRLRRPAPHVCAPSAGCGATACARCPLARM